MTSADILASNEPSGLTRRDGNFWRSDTDPISIQGGKTLVWDVTVTTSLTESHVDTAAIGAEQAANRKLSKYAELASDYSFQPMTLVLWFFRLIYVKLFI